MAMKLEITETRIKNLENVLFNTSMSFFEKSWKIMELFHMTNDGDAMLFGNRVYHILTDSEVSSYTKINYIINVYDNHPSWK